MDTDFGYSPDVDYFHDADIGVNAHSSIQPIQAKGGDIKFADSNIVLYIVIAVVVLAIIYIIFTIGKTISINGEDYYQRNTRKHFNNLHGDAYDDDAKQAIEYGEAIPNPRAIDHFMLGTTYLINAGNPVRAADHLRQALQQIIDHDVDWKEAPFIIERIDDFKDRFIDFPELEELPIQAAILAHFNLQTQMIRTIKKNKATIAEDDPNFTQKVILNKQDWESASQNVHDTAIFEELNVQLRLVCSENTKIPNIQTKDYADVVNWLKIRHKDNAVNKAKIEKVLGFLNENYPIGNIPEFTEQDVIVAVWQRIHDPDNQPRMNEMKEALSDAVLDCVEGSHVVCMTGRTSKIWQALATVDKNSELGVLKTKQALRNEIYERCAKIVDDFVGTNGSASEILKESYQHNENSEQVRELIQCMQSQIDEIKKDYVGLLPSDQLNMVIEECKSIV